MIKWGWGGVVHEGHGVSYVCFSYTSSSFNQHFEKLK